MDLTRLKALFGRHASVGEVRSPFTDSLTLLHVFGADLSPSAEWDLVRWCVAQGASEFSFDFIGSDDTRVRERWDQLAASLRQFYLGKGERPVLTAAPRSDFRAKVDLWALNEASIQVLATEVPNGFFEYEEAEEGWAEDLVVYRNDEILFGVVTHEREGVVQVQPSEVAGLTALGIPLRDRGEWLG